MTRIYDRNPHAYTIYEQLPESLKVALAVAITEPEYAHFGTEELRHLAWHILIDGILDPSIPRILDDTLADWLTQQSRWQDHAQSVLARLHAAGSIDIENSAFPDWYVQPWAQTLNYEWSERLPEAIADAEIYLASLT